MPEQTLIKPPSESEIAIPPHPARKQTGFARLLGISGVIFSLALPIGVVPRILQSQELSENHKKLLNEIPIVSITKVRRAPAQTNLSLPGSIEAITESEIFARTNGYVQQRFADIGDHVKTGQLLAKLQTPEVEESEKEAHAQVLTTVAGKAQSEAEKERAQADLQRAISQVSQAKAKIIEAESDEKFALTTYKRWKFLGDDGAVSWQDVDEKENKYKTANAVKQAALDNLRAAESDVTAAKAKLKAEFASVNLNAANVLASQARASRSSMERSFQNVVSPFDGIVTERNIDQGNLVTAGSENSKVSLYKIARVDIVKVYIDIPQYAAVGVRPGQSVKVQLKEFPARIFQGKIARTAVALDANARTMRTEVQISNSDLALAPGMYADVNIDVPNPGGSNLIPANSLVSTGAGQKVALVSEDKKIHFKNVVLGHDLGTEIEVLAGLKSGESVVVNPRDTLKEGTTVTIAP
jgi:RND family efflux transporter MFP subunit